MAGHEGGCECGSVRYRMSDEPIFVNCCHCRQCQKITGSAFALNGMIETDKLELLEGAGNIEPGGAEVRCNACLTLLWSEHRLFGGGIKFVRLGTLDDGEHFTPDAHFFVRSKHSWIAIPDNLPTFETLPTDRDPPLMHAEAEARLKAARAP